MIVACRPQVPTETAAHATAQQALTKKFHWWAVRGLYCSLLEEVH